MGFFSETFCEELILLHKEFRKQNLRVGFPFLCLSFSISHIWVMESLEYFQKRLDMYLECLFLNILKLSVLSIQRYYSRYDVIGNLGLFSYIYCKTQ